MKKHADSIDAAIMNRIQSGEPGEVFAPTDFLDLGGRATVDQALSRNCRAGLIRKASRGLYDVPHNHPLIGPLSPSSDAVIKAIIRRDRIVLQAAGGRCANDLGISDQVPAKAVYLTNGRSRRIQVGKSQITLKHASSRTMATAGTVSGHVIQALRWIGRRYVDDRIIAQLRRNLKANHKAQLMNDLCHAPAWVADIMRQIAAPA
jgi:hypothetical protein